MWVMIFMAAIQCGTRVETIRMANLNWPANQHLIVILISIYMNTSISVQECTRKRIIKSKSVEEVQIVDA